MITTPCRITANLKYITKYLIFIARTWIILNKTLNGKFGMNKTNLRKSVIKYVMFFHQYQPTVDYYFNNYFLRMFLTGVTNHEKNDIYFDKLCPQRINPNRMTGYRKPALSNEQAH